MGQSIAVVSGKGGTGKSSLTAGVGSALAMLGQKVLCIDCDVGLRNLDLMLGLSDRALMDFSDVAHGNCALADAVVQHPRIPRLFLLTAPLSAGRDPLSTAQFSALVAECKTLYDFVLLDSPAGMEYGFRLAVAAADRVIVVTTSDPASLRDAQRVVMELNYFPLGSEHLVVNRVRRKWLKTMHATIDDAMDTAGLPLLGVVPEDDALVLAAARGIPLLLTDTDYAAKAYRNIAKRICGIPQPLMKIK